MLDDSDTILKKIKKSKTDSQPFPEDINSLDNRPEIKNLINIYCSLSNNNIEEILKEYSGKTFSIFKINLADVVISHLSKITKKIKELLEDRSYLKTILVEGSEKANDIASKNIQDVKKIVGFCD